MASSSRINISVFYYTCRFSWALYIYYVEAGIEAPGER
jgi:hypothetical protein